MSTAKTAGEKRPKKTALADLRALFELCKEFNVLEYKANGLEFRVDVAATMVKERTLPGSIMDDSEEMLKEGKRTLASLLQEKSNEEMWSV